MSCCACCCFYPKYKRKVDNIYPRQIDDPLIKNEVDKLQYYVTTHPEKLSKIGEYLYQYLKYGLHSYKNRNYVKNTVEAVEKVLVATAPQNLNYYAPNCLKIIQKLLEQGGVGGAAAGASDTLMTRAHSSGVSNSNSSSGIHSSSGPGTDNLEYQKMAASLFQKFCEKEASNLASVTYNLNFDTFVCQFSSMCYNSNKDSSVRAEIRSSALQCLATMAKRLVPDDNLKASYMWDNMDKIVPAVLFIMHENYVVIDRESRPINIDDNLQIDEKELDRYLYGDFYINSKSSHNLYGENGQNSGNLTDEDAIRIEFRKTARGSNVHLNEQSNSSSGTSTPDEGKVMISLSKNKVLTNQPTGALDHRQTVGGNSSLQPSLDPDHEAKMLLKTLASKADFTTLAKIVVPILTFLDDNKPNGWECAKIVRCIFLILMYNIKQQHAIVIKELLKHLDSHRNSPAQLKCFVIRTIILNIKIAAMQSIGTTGQIIEIYTNLLKQLNLSVEKSFALKTQLLSKKLGPSSTPAPNNNPIIASGPNMKKSSSTTSANETTSRAQNELTEEHKLQSEIISAMGQFVTNLPDYAKNDVVMFIARQINSPQFHYVDVVQRQNEHLNTREQVQLQQRAKYFECLYEICCKYNPVDQCFAAFNTSSQFLEDILRLTLVGDWSSRRKAHEILQQLLDRYQLLGNIKQLKPSLFTNYFIGSGIVTVKNDSFGHDYRNSNHSLIYRQSIDASPRLQSVSTNSLRQQHHQSSTITTKPSNRQSSSNLVTRNQTYLSQLELNDSRLATCREDTLFMRKYGRLFLAYLNENLFLANNRRENYESIYLTTCLFIVGIFGEKEFLVDLIRFGFHVQELALLNYDQPQFTTQLQCNVHKFVCAYFLLLSKSSGIKELYDYCSDICDLRRTRDLFKFVYPEYILLENTDSSSDTLPNGVGLDSLSEKENEFKRELNNSAKEYSSIVKRQQQSILLEQNELSDSKPNIADKSFNLEASRQLSSSQRSLASMSASNTNLSTSGSGKVAQWLLSKQVVGDILKNAGLPTTLLFQQTSDYSLSVSYLKQTLLSLQTVIKFRSPYSHSFESLVSLTQADIQQLQSRSGHLPSTSSALSTTGPAGQLGSVACANNNSHMTNSASGSNFGATSGHPLISQHKRVTSNLSSHFATTPRRSIDVESAFDGDETSYDSTSQISVDPNELDYLTQQNMRLYTNNTDLDGAMLPAQQSQTSINSFNALKQQYYLQQQQYNDFTSFDTIKKVLFNGTMTGSGIGSNYSNSGAGPTGGSTIVSPASILVTSNPAAALLNTLAPSGSQHQNSLTQRSSQVHQFTLNTNNSMSIDNESASQSSDMQADNNARIINEFKQKPFDELKRTLQKSNQLYVNSEKYQQVLELISKELGVGYQTAPSSSNLQASTQGGVGVISSSSASTTDAIDLSNNINGPVTSKNISYSSLSTTSNQSSAVNANNLLFKENYQQKTTPLNDIEFPELFMYG